MASGAGRRRYSDRTVGWEENEVVVGSMQELDALLDRITGEAEATELPMIAVLGREDGSTLSIGLGRPYSVLSFIDASHDPPYFMSRGEERSDPVAFVFSGEMTEFPPWSAIPTEQAREGIRHFFETGELSPKVDWVEN
jgi:hypothetical protein